MPWEKKKWEMRRKFMICEVFFSYGEVLIKNEEIFKNSQKKYFQK